MAYSITQTFNFLLPPQNEPQIGSVELHVPFTVKEINVKWAYAVTQPIWIPNQMGRPNPDPDPLLPDVIIVPAYIEMGPILNHQLLCSDLNNHVPDGECLASIFVGPEETASEHGLNTYFNRILYDNPKYINGTYRFWLTEPWEPHLMFLHPFYLDPPHFTVFHNIDLSFALEFVRA